MADKKTLTFALMDPPYENARSTTALRLIHIAAKRGYKPGWIYHKYIEKFGMQPPAYSAPAMEPSPEVLSWVRSRDIAYAKGRQKAAAV